MYANVFFFLVVELLISDKQETFLFEISESGNFRCKVKVEVLAMTTKCNTLNIWLGFIFG